MSKNNIFVPFLYTRGFTRGKRTHSFTAGAPNLKKHLLGHSHSALSRELLPVLKSKVLSALPLKGNSG